MNNKKGQAGKVVLLFIIIVVVLFIGLAAGGAIAFTNQFLGDFVPVFSGIGEISDGINMTVISDNTLTPVVNLSSDMNYIGGVFYMIALISILGFSFAFRVTGNKYLIGFYFMLIILLVLVSINVSQTYQDISTGNSYFQDQQILSFLLLYSPAIMIVIAFIGGIIMFSGNTEEIYG